MYITIDENHIYRDDKGQRYASVSSVIKKYKKPFDADVISMAIAKRDNRTQENVLAEWKRKADVSLLKGNFIHDTLELCLTRPELARKSPIEHEINKIRQILPKDHKWTQERIFADTENKIAGTIDLITSKDGRATIWDFKTNELDKKAYNNFLKPFDDLEQTKINEYRFQLSLYKHLVELKKVKVVGLKLLNIINGDVETIDLEPLDIAKVF